MYITHFKLDHFTNNSDEPYIPKRKNTNLLNTLLTEDQSKIEVSKWFIESFAKLGADSLKTKFHLNWIMECIGYTFSLPTSCKETIMQAIRIYDNWLLSYKKPKSFRKNESYYQKEILCHLSLVFSKKDDLKIHAALCTQVLSLINKFIRTQSIKEDTWECLLKLFHLICGEVFNKNIKLAESISSHLLKVYFEVWIRSNNRNTKLWDEAKAHINSWIDHEWVINHLTSVIQALTRSLTCLIYERKSIAVEIFYSSNSKVTEKTGVVVFNLSDEQIIYFWYRFLTIIINGTQNNIKLIPDIHASLVKSIASIIDIFLDVCNKRIQPKPLEILPLIDDNKNPERLNEFLKKFYDADCQYNKGLNRLPIPCINSILDLFGSWLFYHEKIEPSYDAFGKAEIVSILCRIFSKAQSPVQSEYLNRFFGILLKNIANSDQRIIGEMLKNSVDLVSLNVPGVEFLLRPDGFISYLDLYLCDKGTELSIRKPCYVILSTFAALPNYYNLKELSKHVLEIFMSALGDETDADNFFTLVWSISVYASTIKNDRDTLHSILCVLVDRLGSIDYKDIKMYSILLQAITIIPYFIDRGLVSEQVVCRNVNNLQSFIPKRGKSLEDDQTNGLLVALCNWIDCFCVAINDNDIRLNMFKILLNRINIDKFKVLSEHLCYRLINNLQRPHNEQPTINVASIKPQSIPDSQRKHYINNNTLISFYATPSYSGITTRNATGTYGWKLKMITTNKTLPKKLEIPVQVNKWKKIVYKESENKKKRLLDDLTEREKEIFVINQKKFKSQKRTKIPEKNIFFSKSKSLKNSEIPSFSVFHRIFLSQLGLLDDNTSGLCSVSDYKIYKIINEIDSVSEKELISFPVFYLSTPEDNENTIITNTGNYTVQYQNFLNKLGSVVSQRTNMFKHLNEALSKFDKVIYKATKLFDSVAIAPALWISNESYSFLKLISNFSLIVLWNQRANDIHSKKVPNVLNFINLDKTTVIVITCINLYLFKINVYGSSNKTGPLINQMVIPCSLLPKLLLITIYNYQASLASLTGSFEHRNDIIESIKGIKGNTISYIFN